MIIPSMYLIYVLKNTLTFIILFFPLNNGVWKAGLVSSAHLIDVTFELWNIYELSQSTQLVSALSSD